MNKQVKRVSDCPVERLAQCRGEGSPTGVKIYHVCDTGLAEGVALGRITVVLGADFDRVRSERDALQLLLNVADQRVCDLETARDTLEANLYVMTAARDAMHSELAKARMLNDKALVLINQFMPNAHKCFGIDFSLLNETMIGLAHQSAPAAEVCQFPQSCTTMCDCKPVTAAGDDIPDFSPGNGNKARRRAQAIDALKPDNQRIVPVSAEPTAYDGFDNGVD